MKLICSDPDSEGEEPPLFNPVCNGGVDLNSALKRRNYGSIWNTGISIWTNSVHSNTKTNKDLKRKRNSRRESQRRVMHQTNPLSNRGIVLNSDLQN